MNRERIEVEKVGDRKYPRSFTIEDKIYEKVVKKAMSKGQGFSEYMRQLIEEDLKNG